MPRQEKGVKTPQGKKYLSLYKYNTINNLSFFNIFQYLVNYLSVIYYFFLSKKCSAV